MDSKKVIVALIVFLLVACIMASVAMCGGMLYTKRWLGKPYEHPVRDGEFKPLGTITPLSKEKQKARQDAIEKALKE